MIFLLTLYNPFIQKHKEVYFVQGVPPKKAFIEIYI